MAECLTEVLKNVPGWLTQDEAELLYTSVRDWPGYGQCVELGSYQGRSTICMALALEARGNQLDQVISIDKHTGSVEHQPGGSAFDATTLNASTGVISTEHLLRKHLEAFAVSGRVTVTVADSAEAATAFLGQVRILFVDANHDIDHVRADVLAWQHHVACSGCILMHDVGGWPGPTIVAGELLAAGYTRVEQAGTLLALKKNF